MHPEIADVLEGRKRWCVITADCLDVLPTLPDTELIDAVISDPPYGMNWNTDSTRFTGTAKPEVRRGAGRDDWGRIRNDNQPFDPVPWLVFPRVVLWGMNHFAASLPIGTTLIWVKRADDLFGTFMSDAELAWMKGGHGIYCFRKQFPPPLRIQEGNGQTLHPNQKPISLIAWCFERAKVPADALVLDPYCGSGTTGVACLQTGRRFIGIEIDPTYADLARRRLANTMPLFEHAAQQQAEQAGLFDALGPAEPGP